MLFSIIVRGIDKLYGTLIHAMNIAVPVRDAEGDGRGSTFSARGKRDKSDGLRVLG